ncbi:MAG: hypothetical protein JWO09_3658 [Bacteroidetes bacterium]|nr:hypothetical protein [Bacteroidota bacterium]
MSGENKYKLGAGFRFGKTSLVLSGEFGKNSRSKLTAEIGDLTMADIVAYLISIFDGDKKPFTEFPEPWGFLNSINFKGLKLIVEGETTKGAKDKRVGISYPLSIDVKFAQISAIEIYYYPDSKNHILIQPKGTFLGQEFKEWEIYPKQEAPAVPGYGTALFDLKFLGLGQHVTVKGMSKSAGIADTVKALEDNFKEGMEIKPADTAGPEDLIFSPTSGWMIGSRFIIINTVDLSLIYNDPYMYGLALSLSGAKAKTLAGLNIELLYKKINDSIGVYSLHLQLPDAMRQLEFGAVSFTLPVIDIAIYSNGNFRIDLGFPNNNDWSRAATVQVFPFIGAGGFYFALLTGATATRLPSDYDREMGLFNPVIDFGIALRLGIGKTIDKGILKAGLSLCFQGIVTGTYGFFIPDREKAPGRKEDSYYYLNGQFEVVGRVYGEINFSVISARLDVMIYAAIGVVIEAYKDIVLYVNAGVSLSLTVSINLGFIKIKIDLSYSTSISYTFVLPYSGPLPQWRKPDGKSLRNAAMPENPFYTSLAAPDAGTSITELKPKRLRRTGEKTVLPVWFLPQFSARVKEEMQQPELKDQTASFIAGLFLDSGTDKHAGAFGTLAKAYLQWLVTVFKSQLKLTGSNSISIFTLKDLFSFLSKDQAGVPVIGYEYLTGFLDDNFDVQITSPKHMSDVRRVSVFPMLPDLKMQAQLDDQPPFLEVDFSADKVDSGYNKTIQEYFSKMKVGFENPLEAKNNRKQTTKKSVRQSLPTFIFQDYFVLLGRNLLQDCIDLMEAYPYTTIKSDSLASLCSTFDITAEAIVNANANAELKPDEIMYLGGTKYSIQKYDSFESIASYYNFGEQGLTRAFLIFIADTKANAEIINLFIPGATLLIPSGGPPESYICKTGDTLASIARLSKIADLPSAIRELIWMNREKKDILSTFTALVIPKYKFAVNKGMTFASLADHGKISLDRLANNNNKNAAAIFNTGTELTLPQLYSLPDMKVLIDGITEKDSLRKLSGLASRYLLHGLRVPAPAEFANHSGTYALYDLTRQMFDIPAAKAASCTVTLSADLPASVKTETWFRLMPENGSQKNEIRSRIVLEGEDLKQVKKLSTTLFKPKVNSIKKAGGYTINPSRYMLKAPSVWQANAPVFVQGPSGSTWPGGPSGPAYGWWPYSATGSTEYSGPTGWRKAATPKLWYFSDELTKALQEQKSLEPALRLYMGRNNPEKKEFEKKEIRTYGWSTIIPLNIIVVPSSLTPGEELSTMFEIESTSEEGLQLLENLLANQYDPDLSTAERVDVAQVHILYTPAASSDGQGLRSIDPSEVVSAIVQSNLSTVRNPQALKAAAGSVGRIFGSFNQDPVNNIKRLWEACSVKSGGFYLYYFDSNTKLGIPRNTFDEKGHAQISIVITYGLQKPYGYNFTNSMTLGETVPEDSYLFVESQPRDIIIPNNNITVDKLLEKYRLTIDYLAQKLDTSRLKEKLVLNIRTIIFLLNNDEYTADTIAQKYNVNVKDLRELNPGIDYKQGDAVRIPEVRFDLAKNKERTLKEIAALYSVSVISLLWANKGQQLFSDLSMLKLADQSQSKTSSAVPGTVSFNLLRKNPEVDAARFEEYHKDAPTFDPQSALGLNYNLLTFAVKENPSFAASSYSMAVSPDNAGWTGSSGFSPNLSYPGVIPAFNYSKAAIQKGLPSYPAPEKNPYRGTGDIVQVNFDWQDMYGNRTVSPFSNPKLYPDPYPNSFPQVAAYSDPLQSVLQWPAIGIEHLFLPKKKLNVSLAFDAGSYLPFPDKGDAQDLIKKAQTDLETYRKAIYQLSANDVTARVSTSLDPSLENASELKPELLNLMDGIFHYLSAFTVPGYQYFSVKGISAEHLAMNYRMSREYISALNPEKSPPENRIKDYFLPNDNFYLYYTLEDESFTEIAAKLKVISPQFKNISAEEISSLNPGIPEVQGDMLIVIPDQRLQSYEPMLGETLEGISIKTGVSTDMLKAANPGISETPPARQKILIPRFSSTFYTTGEGDTLKGLAAKFNVPEPVLNAATCKHTRPLQAGKTILIPDGDFKLYRAKEGDTLSSIAAEKWVAYKTLCLINPALTNELAAGTDVLLPKTPVPLVQSFRVDIKNKSLIFPLEVWLTISRQAALVDEAFLDQPEVTISSSLIPPHLSITANNEFKKNTPASESRSLLNYAESFEKTFSEVKIATLGDKAASRNQLYAVRINKGEKGTENKGISFFIKNEPDFYAPIPLATYPLSATFRVPQYVSGKGFTGPCFNTPKGCMGATGAGTLNMTFQGMQLDPVAQDLFESVDQLLQPDLTRGLLQLDGTLNTSYRQQLLDAKKKIAQAYGSHLVKHVLSETSHDTPADVSEALQQQMLQRLSNLYSIGTIIQLPVTVSKHITDPALIFGNPVNINEKAEDQVTFSSAQISLQQSNSTSMTFVLNARQPEKNKNISLNLAYKPLAMEFNIHPIPGINDYKASQWLFFVKPLPQITIGEIEVPVPLRDFPVPPTVLEQEAKGVDDETPALEATRRWKYAFTFRNPDTAAQDAVYSSTLFNIENYNLKLAADVPDLFFGLATWSVAGREMMSDMLRCLPKLQQGERATTPLFDTCNRIVKSYLSVVTYVAAALPVWLDVRSAKYKPKDIESGAMEFLMLTADESDEYFFIQLKAPAGTGTVNMPYPTLPEINKRRYNPTQKAPGTNEKNDEQKYFFIDEENNYLRTAVATESAEAKSISLTFGAYPGRNEHPGFGTWLDIMERWNAWGGAYITRNEYLVKGKITNPDFVYRTPVVRPYNASAPLLDYSTPFDIHLMPLPAKPLLFEEQMRNMLYNFFGGDNGNNPKIRLKLVWSYSYCINAGVTDPYAADALYVTLPGGLIPPFTFTIPNDWNSDPGSNSFACQLSAVIRKWLEDNEVPGAEAGARIQFDITAFSNLPDNKLPFYRLRNLFLNVKDLILK